MASCGLGADRTSTPRRVRRRRTGAGDRLGADLEHGQPGARVEPDLHGDRPSGRARQRDGASSGGRAVGHLGSGPAQQRRGRQDSSGLATAQARRARQAPGPPGSRTAAPDSEPRYSGWCLDKEDSCAAKLCAFREKDQNFVSHTAVVELLLTTEHTSRTSPCFPSAISPPSTAYQCASHAWRSRCSPPTATSPQQARSSPTMSAGGPANDRADLTYGQSCYGATDADELRRTDPQPCPSQDRTPTLAPAANRSD
jgi:hypothetical protein